MTSSFAAHDNIRPALPVPAGGWVIGANVPWSVAWTGEESFDVIPSNDFPGLLDLTQSRQPGAGAPKFAALHITRHRHGMFDLLCHVCGKPTLKRDRYIFPIQSGALAPLPDGSIRYIGNVPPVHLRCAKRAQRLCPHLIRAFADPVPYPSEPSRLLPRTDIPLGLENLARDLSKSLPAGIRIAYTCYRVHGPNFTALVQTLRRQNRNAAGKAPV